MAQLNKLFDDHSNCDLILYINNEEEMKRVQQEVEELDDKYRAQS